MKVYAVVRGRDVGIMTWKECQEATKGYKGAVFKSFDTIGEAEAFILGMSDIVNSYHTVYAFQPNLKWNHEQCYLLRFDGGANPNPGSAGAGAVIYGPVNSHGQRSIVLEGGRYFKKATNNEAEYNGLIHGLEMAKSLNIRHLVIEGDSKLVVEQVRGAWKANKPHLQTLLEETISHFRNFEFIGIRHIYRDQNTRADELTHESRKVKKTFTRYVELNAFRDKFFGGLNFII